MSKRKRLKEEEGRDCRGEEAGCVSGEMRGERKDTGGRRKGERVGQQGWKGEEVVMGEGRGTATGVERGEESEGVRRKGRKR